MNRNRIGLAFALVAIAALVACQKKAESPPPPQQQQTSIIALMSGTVAPTADKIWNAVSSESTATGTVDHKPTTDKDWAELRAQVMKLVDAADQLAVPDRPVILPGQKLTNPPGEGDLTTEQAQAKIKEQWPAFVAYAQGLKTSALAALKTVDARDADKFVEAGGGIDEACENCHKAFWYPGGGEPQVK
jgi:cytochrome c556